MQPFLPAALLAFSAPAALAQLELAAPFTDHMVVQRGEPIVLWGTAEAGAAVSATLGRSAASAIADADGEWFLELPALPAGGPHAITVVAGAEAEQLEDVLVGDVWLCSGQSNMDWSLALSGDADAEIANARHGRLRLFDMDPVAHPLGTRWDESVLERANPRDYFQNGPWKRCEPDAARGFSAVGYHFGRELTDRLDVPIGLICNAIGGAPIEPYISRPSLAARAELADFAAPWPEFADSGRLGPWPSGRVRHNLGAWFDDPVGPMPGHPFLPSFLYDAGVAPIARLPLAGVIWYQGESNATTTDSWTPADPDYCRAGIETLIADWRATFGRELPFLYVQLAAHNRSWMAFREVQRQCLAIPGTSMVVTTDIGDATDIHPRDKREVGRRLALAALADVYGGDDFGARSPSVVDASYAEGTVQLTFTDVGGGLGIRGGGEPEGFEVVGADGLWTAARARVNGRSATVWSPSVQAPVAVRYAWAPVPRDNVVGGTGLPLAPFVEGDAPGASESIAGNVESFEATESGEIGLMANSAGRWAAATGHARIDPEHARSGAQCLHLLGGDDRRISLTPNLADPGVVRFWAERWTRTDPFEFRVEARFGAEWREVYRGDDEVVIGTFRTPVEFGVPEGAQDLRFRCTSPSGVLIDDLILEPARPMALAGCRQESLHTPLIEGREGEPATALVLDIDGSRGDLSLVEAVVAVEATAVERAVRGVRFGPAGAAGEAVQRADSTWRGRFDLRPGTNRFELQIDVGRGLAAGQRVAARVESILLSDGRRVEPTSAGDLAPARAGLALRDAGDDGVAVHRIPGLITTPRGTLLAVYDLRRRGWGDLPGDIDVGLSRSTDGGATWEALGAIMDQGEDPAFQYDGVGDPSILVDDVTGTVWVAATWSHGDRSWRGSGPGLAPDETGQLLLVRSDDDGLSWSEPINITAQVKRPEWCFLLPGPGRGITMADGTLVFPAQYQETPERNRLPYSTILYSRDRGETWQLGSGARGDTTEAQVVEVEPGVLMLNARNNGGEGRAIYTTRDLGVTWGEHPTSRHVLTEPICNAALVSGPGASLIFCNPAVSAPPRRAMTLKLSRDRGQSWDPTASLLLDAGESAGYPALTLIDDRTLGVLFEGSRAQLTFMRVPLDELLR